MSNITFIHKGAVLKGYFDPFCTELRSPVPIIYSSHYPNCGADLLMEEAQKHSEGTGKRKKEQREKEGGREGGDLPLFSSHFLTEGLSWGYRVIEKINRPFLFFFRLLTCTSWRKSIDTTGRAN